MGIDVDLAKIAKVSRDRLKRDASDIVERQRRSFAANGLDALISCSPENFAYAAGFVVPSQP